MNNSYKIKYLKYQNKYIQLKNQIYGAGFDDMDYIDEYIINFVHFCIGDIRKYLKKNSANILSFFESLSINDFFVLIEYINNLKEEHFRSPHSGLGAYIFTQPYDDIFVKNIFKLLDDFPVIKQRLRDINIVGTDTENHYEINILNTSINELRNNFVYIFMLALSPEFVFSLTPKVTSDNIIGFSLKNREFKQIKYHKYFSLEKIYDLYSDIELEPRSMIYHKLFLLLLDTPNDYFDHDLEDIISSKDLTKLINFLKKKYKCKFNLIDLAKYLDLEKFNKKLFDRISKIDKILKKKNTPGKYIVKASTEAPTEASTEASTEAPIKAPIERIEFVVREDEIKITLTLYFKHMSEEEKYYAGLYVMILSLVKDIFCDIYISQSRSSMKFEITKTLQIYGGVIDSNPNKDKIPLDKSDFLQYTSDKTEWKKRQDAFSDYVKQGSLEAEIEANKIKEAEIEAKKAKKALRSNQTLYAAVVDFNQHNYNNMTIISVHKTEAEAQEQADKQATIDKHCGEPYDTLPTKVRSFSLLLD